MTQAIEELYRIAEARAAANDLQGCADLLQRLLAAAPEHVEGLRLMGKLLLHVGGTAQGRTLLTRAQQLCPDHAQLSHEAGVAALQAGDMADAVECFRRQLRRAPNHVDSLFNLAWALRRLERLDEAAAHYREALRLLPAHGEAWYNLSCIHLATRQYEDAAAAGEQALAAIGPRADVVANLVVSLLRLGRPEQAGAQLEATPPANRASAAYQAARGEWLAVLGRHAEAADSFAAALALEPGHPASLLRRGQELTAQSRHDQAISHLTAALEAHPEAPGLPLALAQALLAAGDMTQAAEMLRGAVEMDESVEALATLGKALALTGDHGGAVDAFRRALALDPSQYGVHSNLLLTLLHDGSRTPAEVRDHHFAFGRFWEERLKPGPGRTAVDDGDRRLRIGYVSPDFCEHAVNFFFEPILEHHDRNAVEVFAYHIPRRTDAVTARLRGKADHWRTLVPGALEAAAETIRADRIDILFDLAGHTAHNMLPLFALRPAPIQVSGIGYPATTGLTRVDYRLMYGGAPQGADLAENSSERLITLPTMLPFRPPTEAGDVAPPPCGRNGFVTFGSVGKYSKISPEVRQIWAGILRAVPSARLKVIVPGAENGTVRDSVLAEFAAHGADAARIDLSPECAFAEWLALLAEVDVILDPFPYAGGTTSRLCTWMGVPIVRMMPERPNRTPAVIYCANADDYVAAAVDLAADPAALGPLRATLRARAMLDAAQAQQRFVRELEDFYRSAWRAFLAGGHLDG